MKNFFLTLFVTASVLSCSKDDDGASAMTSNQVSLGDSMITFSNENAVVLDYGQDGTHYNRDFEIDGTINGKEVELDIELYALGEAFSTGVFQVDNTETASYLYAEMDIITPAIGGNAETTEYYNSTSGTITVTKIKGNTYTFVIDLVFEGGEAFIGTLQITFTEGTI
ncbi:hypothetical protein [Changchengzhania lutea]|uniref:hypothetical protein n=1 Tax=Changchengzhania lutea TaxID=2049305 RepID=UPI00115CA990|nr:hypothetical protein [Changchengzhania lutea]